MPKAKHPRTIARRSAGLSLAEAARRIGITPHSLECFELDETRTLAGKAQRARARQIYGVELVPYTLRQQLKKCAGPGCLRQITREHERKILSGKLRIKGKRFCSYRCRMAYQKRLIRRSESEMQREQKRRGQQIEAQRRPRQETRAIAEIVKINQQKKSV